MKIEVYPLILAHLAKAVIYILNESFGELDLTRKTTDGHRNSLKLNNAGATVSDLDYIFCCAG